MFCQFILTNVESRDKTIEIDQYIRTRWRLYFKAYPLKISVIYYEDHINQETILKWIVVKCKLNVCMKDNMGREKFLT